MSSLPDSLEVPRPPRSYLDSSGVTARMARMLEDGLNSPLAAVMVPGIVKFFGESPLLISMILMLVVTWLPRPPGPLSTSPGAGPGARSGAKSGGHAGVWWVKHLLLTYPELPQYCTIGQLTRHNKPWPWRPWVMWGSVWRAR